MVASGATLAQFFPKDAEQLGAPISITRYNGVPALVFPKPLASGNVIPRAFFNGVLNRVATLGFSATTGLTCNILWSAPHQQVAGTVRWAISFDFKGATDKPLANGNLIPADGGAGETAATTAAVNATAGGMNYTAIAVTLANMKTNSVGAQVTAVAAGDFFRVQLRRVVDNAGDTITDEIYVHAFELVDV